MSEVTMSHRHCHVLFLVTPVPGGSGATISVLCLSVAAHSLFGSSNHVANDACCRVH